MELFTKLERMENEQRETRQEVLKLQRMFESGVQQVGDKSMDEMSPAETPVSLNDFVEHVSHDKEFRRKMVCIIIILV